MTSEREGFICIIHRPELPFIIVGMIASIGFGIASPLFAAVFGDMLEVLSEPDIETARTNSQLAALKLGGVGFGFFIPTAIQVTAVHHILVTRLISPPPFRASCSRTLGPSW